jgi:DnaJ-class molecular chaperone
MPKPVDACLTCHGVGETVTESGAETCPDCFGEGNVLSRGTKLEWRLRAIGLYDPTPS